MTLWSFQTFQTHCEEATCSMAKHWLLSQNDPVGLIHWDYIRDS